MEEKDYQRSAARAKTFAEVSSDEPVEQSYGGGIPGAWEDYIVETGSAQT